MTRAQRSRQPAPSARPVLAVPAGFLQRQCACGGYVGPSEDCEDCRKKELLSQPPLIQPKLKINQPNERYEKEADCVAQQITRLSQSAPDSSTCQKSPRHASRQTRQPLTPADRSDPDVPPRVHEVLRSSGQPMDERTRVLMEPYFGHDFGSVRVHHDPRAAESAQQVNALAYTVGSHVVFGAGQYRPNSVSGQRLLAHELTHVVQQTKSPRVHTPRPSIQRAEVDVESQQDCPDDYDSGEQEKARQTPMQLVDTQLLNEALPPGVQVGKAWLLYEFPVASSDSSAKGGDLDVLLDEVFVYLVEEAERCYGRSRLVFVGYTDCIGSGATNEQLRTERARQVAVAFPFPEFVQGAAPGLRDHYIASNANRDGRARNRSVVIQEVYTRLSPDEATACSKRKKDQKKATGESGAGDLIPQAQEALKKRSDERGRRLACVLDLLFASGRDVNDEYLKSPSARAYMDSCSEEFKLEDLEKNEDGSYTARTTPDNPSRFAYHLKTEIFVAVADASGLHDFVDKLEQLDEEVVQGLRKVKSAIAMGEAGCIWTAQCWIGIRQQSPKSIYNCYTEEPGVAVTGKWEKKACGIRYKESM